MSKYNLTLPKMGESVEEATIVNWLKNVGDNIKMDDFIVEVATDKVDSEVPSDVEGVLIEKCFKINDVVKVGETLCVIEVKEGVSKKITETITNIELLEPLGNDSPISNFLIKNPSGGVHHLCYEVSDIKESVE